MSRHPNFWRGCAIDGGPACTVSPACGCKIYFDTEERDEYVQWLHRREAERRGMMPFTLLPTSSETTE